MGNNSKEWRKALHSRLRLHGLIWLYLTSCQNDQIGWVEQILFVLHECKGTKCKMTGPRILFSFSNVTVSTERTLMIS